MKNILFTAFFILLSLKLSAQTQPVTDKDEQEMMPSKNDSGEWELTVMDTQFDYFIKAVARPVSQYSETYLKSRNSLLVSQWNSYFSSGRYRDVIESSIVYDPQEKYGLKFEYKLYQVFAYVHWKYGLKMNGLGAADAARR